MGFSGWPLEAVEFFRGLQADNTKTYWNVYQALYEASVREPMAELAAAALEEHREWSNGQSLCVRISSQI